VTAGLYVGEIEAKPHKTIGADHLITDRKVLREHPPDILLTNYKMLDYLLIRPADHRLWRYNQPETLRYLVVDELHTFDGAQGTDLACLIRRLRLRLRAAQDGLVCIGASATLGRDETGGTELGEYASQIFGSSFDDDAVIREHRKDVDAFLGDRLIEYVLTPGDDLKSCTDPACHATTEAYLRAQHQLFFGKPIDGDFDSPGWRLALGKNLRKHQAFFNLLRVLDGKPRSMDEIVQRLGPTLPLQRIDVADRAQVAGRLVNSLCALVSVARSPGGAGGATRHFLNVGTHLWIRELRRMVCRIGGPGEGSGTSAGIDSEAETGAEGGKDTAAIIKSAHLEIVPSCHS